MGSFTLADSTNPSSVPCTLPRAGPARKAGRSGCGKRMWMPSNSRSKRTRGAFCRAWTVSRKGTSFPASSTCCHREGGTSGSVRSFAPLSVRPLLVACSDPARVLVSICPATSTVPQVGSLIWPLTSLFSPGPSVRSMPARVKAGRPSCSTITRQSRSCTAGIGPPVDGCSPRWMSRWPAASKRRWTSPPSTCTRRGRRRPRA